MEKEQRYKFAIIGTSCSGKTTKTYEILGNLKKLGISVDGVMQQDRRLVFDKELLETEKDAQYWIILNQICKDIELKLNETPEVLISDRSILDFYAYLETMYGRDDAIFGLVKKWCETYTCLYYMKPLDYRNDKTRPSDKFRTKVDKVLLKIIKEISNVKLLNENEIYDDILNYTGKKLSWKELKLVKDVIEKPILVGGSYAFNRQTRKSDVDIYVLDNGIELDYYLEKKLKRIFGVPFDVTIINSKVWNYLHEQGFKVIE